MDCRPAENSVLTQDLKAFASSFPFNEEIKGKSFLITGATGLIGSLIVKALLEINRLHDRNVEILATARNPGKIFDSSSVEWIIQDITAPLAIDREVDFIFHCAGITDSKQMIQHPVEVLQTMFDGTRNILSLSRQSGTQSLVYLSSIESYGTFIKDQNIKEDASGYVDPMLTRSCYPMGKRAAETLCYAYFSEYNLPVKVARLTQTFGAGVDKDDRRVFAQFAKCAIAGEPIVLHTEGSSSKPYCYTIDALNALFYILLKGQDGEAYNVANASTYISVKEMAHLVARNFGNSEVVINASENTCYAPPTLSRLDTSKLESLGWKPEYSLEDMYSRLIEYIKEENGTNKP